ncbi:S1C family serine protease [Microbulbifer thermotolerans]|uniref:2-alkenal reductase n=1 Tax=Microbulbifer thermotolerans TaxID=252514 RepID=A0A143HK06_MICTH|nr:trypsin-like peptidase domain-containing protein [Microbulbifer thermotolerans]AMX02038.1 2-alkenal reductase [Microbulbifer thermotolerans]MCX2780777.1 trypsin-like peptidase domain-containing protein [Microbulbifer thermotolerans]MCX2783093.1 trypsin-like peptidase domain-containing protein [Microbulbifer thermotolerans]MCX2794305.1 trypsin-like peptidase domain-containing protein [Microbulbifer thermotolerans]MCX2806492.1 trypsin-like peptidase domain-containing protein [Microbulbifer th
MSLQRFIQDWAAPTGIGLAVAALLLFVFPQLRNGAPSPQAGEWQGPVSYASAVSLAGPAVVNIYTRKAVPQRQHPLFNDPLFQRLFNSMNLPQRERMQSNLGSGVIVSDDGYILTNHHVVDEADAIVVLLADGREAQAQLVGSDADFDLAVLKIELPSLTSIEVGEPEKAQVGDVVLAIGNPFGVGQTVTQGIISATGERNLNLAATGAGGYLQNFLQTDAAVNPGNSGGALVDAHGRLLGINTSILNQSGYSGGISFAIPANIAFKVMQDIIEYGRVVPGWLGIEAQAVTPQLARNYNLASTNGVLITAIYNQGPAHHAGLKPGDVITHIDGLPINDGRRGVATMATLRPGDTISITFIRDGVVDTVEATVSERPNTQRRS